MSLGLRGDALPAEADRAWRVGAEFALAAADAVEDSAGLSVGSVALKWPNDLVLRNQEGGVTTGFRKFAGLLMEGSQLGTLDATLVVGLGLNVRGDPARLDAAFAATATSLELASGRPIDREALFDDLLARLEGRLRGLAAGRFDVAGWRERQLLEGWEAELDLGAEGLITGRVVGFDGSSGALILGVNGTERAILAGEVARVVRAATP
jgi:biotin-(acetyl-CoA carboxylase) ligase